MHRRNGDHLLEEPLRKRLCLNNNNNNNTDVKEIKSGAVITDNLGKQWRLGKTIGTGGFGQIYLASSNVNKEVGQSASYVAKVEGHLSGPLFVEINCYLRAARLETINEWKAQHKMDKLGIPHYVASGCQQMCDTKSRFLILPRFQQDLEQIFVTKKRKFNLKTVLTLGIQMMDMLEYIHGKGFIHADIKASNLLVGTYREQKRLTVSSTASAPPSLSSIRFRGCNPVRSCRFKVKPKARTLRPVGNVKYFDNSSEAEEEPIVFETAAAFEEVDSTDVVDENQVYLLDYGLASKYINPDGTHKEYCSDNRRAHAGTTLFCSLDAHSGSQSRRSDLESLGYNMIYWLTSHLPWMDDIEDPEVVETKKQKCMSDLKNFLQFCFGQYPRFIYDYLEYIRKLRFDTKPNYLFCKQLFREALKDYGYQLDNCFDFDNLLGWGQKVKRQKSPSENILPKSNVNVVVSKIYRQPLRSNLTVVKRALTRNKKTTKSKKRQINWSKILMDPEEILRQANKEKHVENEQQRIRRTTESSDGSGHCNGLQNFDIWQLNPTPTMVRVYNRIMDRLNAANGMSPKHRGDSGLETIEGYTATMVAVYNRKKEMEQEEYEMVVISNKKKVRSTKTSLIKNTTSMNPVKPGKRNVNTRKTKSTSNAVKNKKLPRPVPVPLPIVENRRITRSSAATASCYKK